MNNIPQQGFYFDGKNGRHDYFYDGKRMTGCTTILNVIAKPFLIQWAANMAIQSIKDNGMPIEEFVKKLKTTPETKITIGENVPKDYLVITDELLEEARTAHRRKKEEAGQKGTDIHTEIETIIKETIYGNGYIQTIYDTDKEQIKHFWDWARTNKVKFLESEKQLYSKELWIAGTCDFICEIEGKVWLGDIKTSSGIYPEHFAQCAGYQIMIDENKLYEIAGHIIVNLKKTGEFEEKRSISVEDYKKFFLAALDIYRVQEKIRGTIL